METALASASAIADQTLKIDRYKDILATVIDSNNVHQANTFLNHVLSDDVQLYVSRDVMRSFVLEFERFSADAQKFISAIVLAQFQPQDVYLKHHISIIRIKVAELYDSEGEWPKAAQILSGIDLELDSSMIRSSGLVDDKLSLCLKILHMYLRADDFTNGEAIIRKASCFLRNSQNETLNFHYKPCFARLMVLKGKLMGAALFSYFISQTERRIIGDNYEETVEEALTVAVTCTISAGAGSMRSRFVVKLYEDERCQKLNVWPILEKVYMERILRKPEIDAFAKARKPSLLYPLFGKALPPDNLTVWDHAVIKHNLLCASKLYKIISFDQLGLLLGIAPEKAERIASTMISEDMLRGSIDQVEAFIHFEDDTEEMQVQDQQIFNLCQSLDDIIDSIANKRLINSNMIYGKMPR